jgi:hypothetical protein
MDRGMMSKENLTFLSQSDRRYLIGTRRSELAGIQIGDIVLETTDGRQLALRRVARPRPEQARILAALKLNLPERLSPDRLM